MRTTSASDQDRQWVRLIDKAVGRCVGEFDCTLTLDINGVDWHAYSASIDHREILFYCEEGTALYVVDTYGDRHSCELLDWESD